MEGGWARCRAPPPGCPQSIELKEPTFDPDSGFYGPIPLACPVASGFVVLLDFDGPNQRLDPHNPEQNRYVVTGATGVTIEYVMDSDSPEGPTPAPRSSWGRIKILYR